MITKTMICAAIHGETDPVIAQRVLDDVTSQLRPLPDRASWPVAKCGVSAVFLDAEGTRLEIEIQDWDIAATLKANTTFNLALTI